MNQQEILNSLTEIHNLQFKRKYKLASLNVGILIRILEQESKALQQADVIRTVCDHCTDEHGQNIGNMYMCPKCGRAVD